VTALRSLTLEADGPHVAAQLPAGSAFTVLRRLRVAGACDFTTRDEETCVLVLAGTFDLVGGGTAWPSRGARSSPLHGRPVAVFLPPRTPFAARAGDGELLVLSARQPPAPPPTGRDALRQGPLLQLAGSGKAFDPGTGEWRPAETFPSAPESLPPRRIERVELGAASVERVFAADYKAQTLCVDELVLPAGAAVSLALLPLPAAARECLLWVRTDAGARVDVQAGADALSIEGEGAAWFGASPAGLRCSARDAAACVVAAYAGKDPAH
jgi:hypothetical protein